MLSAKQGNVSRILAYTWHDRFSDGNTDNTSHGRMKYKNCRIVMRQTRSTVTSDAPYEKLLGWSVLVNIQHNIP